MPSMDHEILVDLFKNRPSLAAELLVEVLGVPLPPHSGARTTSIDLTQIQPAEYRADVVVLLLGDELPVSVLIVEVQLAIDPRKHFTWPEYTMGARAIHRCPAGLLVVAPDPDVAAWCAQPIETGIPGFVLRPPVLGHEAVPIVTDTAEAARRPELGVLSALAHGAGEQGANIAAAVLPAIRELDEDRARFYGDLVLNSLDDTARRALEAMVKGYEYQSDFAKKYVAQGRDQGRQEGRREGRLEGERAVLLRQLRARFGELPEAAVVRIEAAEIAALEQWAERVLSATTLADVLDVPS
nr:DUF4351 domain-containing protein [Sorangium cellulosum]